MLHKHRNANVIPMSTTHTTHTHTHTHTHLSLPTHPSIHQTLCNTSAYVAFVLNAAVKTYALPHCPSDRGSVGDGAVNRTWQRVWWCLHDADTAVFTQMPFVLFT